MSIRPGEQRSDEGMARARRARPVPGGTRDRRAPRSRSSPKPGTGSERPHAAGVRAAVAVLRALEVLRHRERDGVTCRRRARTPRPRGLRAAPRSRAGHRARRARRARPRPRPRVRQTTTPLPAARPSALRTQGATGSASVAAVGTPAAAITSFANVFEPSIAAAPREGPNTEMPTERESVRETGDERHLGPDDDEVDLRAPARGRAPPRYRRRGQGDTARAPRCRGSRAQRGAPSAAATGRASRPGACSRPPDPTRRTRTGRVYFDRSTAPLDRARLDSAAIRIVRRVSRIDWVISSCRLLAAIGDEFDRTRPFAGISIGTGIHLEPKTVALAPRPRPRRRGRRRDRQPQLDAAGGRRVPPGPRHPGGRTVRPPKPPSTTASCVRSSTPGQI